MVLFGNCLSIQILYVTSCWLQNKKLKLWLQSSLKNIRGQTSVQPVHFNVINFNYKDMKNDQKFNIIQHSILSFFGTNMIKISELGAGLEKWRFIKSQNQ